jgi:hypothetical protein
MNVQIRYNYYISQMLMMLVVVYHNWIVIQTVFMMVRMTVLIVPPMRRWMSMVVFRKPLSRMKVFRVSVSC